MSELLDEALLERLRIAIRGFVAGRVRNTATAEDITQDVLLKISTRLDSLRGTDRIEAWAFRIAKNTISDYFRAARPTERFQGHVHSKSLISAAEPEILSGGLPFKRRNRYIYSIGHRGSTPDPQRSAGSHRI